MDHLEAKQEYARALRMGQKEVKELSQKNLPTAPAVLEEILGPTATEQVIDIGVVEIPTERIVGTKTAGRITAFSPSFLPLLSEETEFCYKWTHLCAAHLSDEGIREPILCYEYLGNFYVQEGNKRVSVLRYFDAPTIPGTVLRVMPAISDDPKIQAYYEFIEFYNAAKLYDIQFRQPGDYAKLLSFLGKESGEPWTEREQKTFRAYFQYFRDAFTALRGDTLDLLPEEALLLWLRVYSFQDLGKLSSGELKKAMTALWGNIVSISQEEPVQVEVEPDTEAKGGILSILLPTNPDHLNVAFIHQLDPGISTWTRGHDEGSTYLQQTLGDKVTVWNYYHADTPERTEELLEQAVEAGAEVVFTTTPKLSRATLKAAVKYPKIRFLNCSVYAPYSSIRTYYSRIYEAKFIAGALAGAMSENDWIGYVGDYPIFGVPASINAYALGAQLTNPRAKIVLRWSCQAGNPVEEFIQSGIRVISNRDIPTPNQRYLEFGSYGTYLVEENRTLRPIGSPCWMWGRFYEHVIRSILNGAWDRGKDAHHAVNYWWGIDSGVIDIKLPDTLPESLVILTDLLRKGLQRHTLDPFRRRLVAQDGTVKNPGNRTLTPDELLHMDWLCDNIEGSIPEFDEIQPYAQDMVRELGVYRDRIPMEKEGTL